MEQPNSPQLSQVGQNEIIQWIKDLADQSTRANAILRLSGNAGRFPDMGPLLWESFGALAVLVQEITSIYPVFFCQTLEIQHTYRACRVITIMETITHSDRRGPFLRALIPLYLSPFLMSTNDSIEYRVLKERSLAFFVTLTSTHDPEVVYFLLKANFVATCLRLMDDSRRKIQYYALYIVNTILSDDDALRCICESNETFAELVSALQIMVWRQHLNPNSWFVAHILRCYTRLSTNDGARLILRDCLPAEFRDDTFTVLLQQQSFGEHRRYQLLSNLGLNRLRPTGIPLGTMVTPQILLLTAADQPPAESQSSET